VTEPAAVTDSSSESREVDTEDPDIAAPSAEEQQQDAEAAQSLREYEEEHANIWHGYDLDCSDFTTRNIPITGSDPNRLDRDGDGVGCEQ